LGLLAQTNLPGMQESYETACREHGHQPGFTLLPERDTPSVIFVAEDVDAAWRELGPHLLHDARSYADWNPGNETSAGISHVKTVSELRATSKSHRIFSVDEAVAHVRNGGMLTLSPLCGGVPPDIAWPYLDRVVSLVLPAVTAHGGVPADEAAAGNGVDRESARLAGSRRRSGQSGLCAAGDRQARQET
jgi:hypothetical protein